MEDLVLSRESGLNVKREEYVELLETEIAVFHSKMEKEPHLQFDENYITYIECLRMLNSNSKLLNQYGLLNKDNEELDSEIMDYWLVKEPIKQGKIIRHTSDLGAKEIKESLSYGYSMEVATVTNVLGLEFRATYNEGYLLKARLVGLDGLGQDITDQMLFLLGEFKESLEDLELCEIRGKITLAIKSKDCVSTLTEISNKLFNYEYDSELLSLVVLVDNILSDKTYNLTYYSRLEEIREKYGFNTPLYALNRLSKNDFKKSIDDCMLSMDLIVTDYNYTITGINLYNNLGCRLLCTLELGKWKPYAYEGYVETIRWDYNSVYGVYKPYAVLETPITTKTGAIITEIPLYTPASILILECYSGNQIRFIYGQKTGALPVYKDFRVLLDKDLFN